MNGPEQFEMDSVDDRDASGQQSPEPASVPGSAHRSKPDTDSEEREPRPTANADIELSRRAVPVIEADDDVCSVCLDCFTQDDPGNQTGCG